MTIKLTAMGGDTYAVYVDGVFDDHEEFCEEPLNGDLERAVRNAYGLDAADTVEL